MNDDDTSNEVKCALCGALQPYGLGWLAMDISDRLLTVCWHCNDMGAVDRARNAGVQSADGVASVGDVASDYPDVRAFMVEHVNGAPLALDESHWSDFEQMEPEDIAASHGKLEGLVTACLAALGDDALPAEQFPGKVPLLLEADVARGILRIAALESDVRRIAAQRDDSMAQGVAALKELIACKAEIAETTSAGGAWLRDDGQLMSRATAVEQVADHRQCDPASVDDAALDMDGYTHVALVGEINPRGTGERVDRQARLIEALGQESRDGAELVSDMRKQAIRIVELEGKLETAGIQYDHCDAQAELFADIIQRICETESARIAELEAKIGADGEPAIKGGTREDGA